MQQARPCLLRPPLQAPVDPPKGGGSRRSLLPPPYWLVVWRDLPTLQYGHLLGKRGVLDASCHFKLLHYILPHQSQLVEVPGLHHLALLREAEDGDYLHFHRLAGGRHVPELSLLGALDRYAVNHLIPFCDLLVNADV